ncbi:DUF3263 domain-containing protein [Nakamurella sp. A5-74]|uniref:DUF3263 domain-containing protein n=1 Tax=Nakamurella sp. A5-74 TaxID=3158264 RepID=A0AAU8DTK9_9ACTN
MTAPVEVLEFESRAWVHAGAKEQPIADELGLSATRYYQLLREALLDPTAVASHPATAARMRRILEQQRSRLTERSAVSRRG